MNARTLLTGLLATTAAACARPPSGQICPAAGAGDLVITEVRGSQADGADTFGQWIELTNRSGGELDIHGLSISLRAKNGDTPSDILVRESLVVPDGGRVVLGHHKPDEVPEFVDYTFFSDHFSDETPKPDIDDDGPNDEDMDEFNDGPRDIRTRSLLGEGIIELLDCDGEVIDRLVYDELPSVGSFSLSGTVEPDADANDDLALWCADETPAPDGGSQVGTPGTPGQENTPCP